MSEFNEGAEEQNFLGMSDADFANADLSELDASFVDVEPAGAEDEQDLEAGEARAEGAGESDGDVEIEEEGSAFEDPDDEDERPSADAEEDDAGAEQEDEEGDADTESDPDGDDSGDDGESGADDPVDEDGEESEEKSEDTPAEVDMKTFYEQVTAEFKANGKMMKVDSPEDAVRLMQMGAAFNSKMAAFKPYRRIVKVLENNGIKEEDLGFLVDLKAKKPEAIAKLLADSEIDPLDFNLDQAAGYTASDVSVDEREINLDDVVEDLRESPHYQPLIQLVTKQWDGASKQAVANEPELLRVIDSHMANGVYELVSNEVAQERMFGRLNGMSDIEAYTKIGDDLAAKGAFAHLFKPKAEQRSPETPKEASKPKLDPKVAEKQRRDKRRAASPSKGSVSPGTQSQEEGFNPLALSDEEYMKQFDEKFL